jgi:hypothetical protein
MENLIEIKLPGYTVFLSRSEIQALLRQNPAIWKESIERGKYILRSRKQREREARKEENDC